MAYEEERLDAHNDIRESGAPVTLRWTTPNVVNGADGTVTPGVEQTLDTYGLLLRYKNGELMEVRDEAGTSILRTDKKLLMSALDAHLAGVSPAVGMKAEVAGTVYRVMGVTPLEPGGVPILYWLQLRV